MSTINVYVRPDDKIKLLRKSDRLGISLSKLLIESALNYEVPERSKLYLNNQCPPNKPVPVNQEAAKR